MTTMTEHLAATGVSLGQRIGLIVESHDESGAWQAVYARIGRVCIGIPIEAAGHAETQDFDPEYDIALLWDTGSDPELCILQMTDDSVLYNVDAGGIIIEDPNGRAIIGQSDHFMQRACEIWCTLSQPQGAC